MTNALEAERKARRLRHRAILAEVADEEAEAAEAEVAERRASLEVPMHLRIDKDLDDYLRNRATDEGIPVSAVVRQILRAAAERRATNLSEADVESIARRVAREESQHQ